MVKLVNHIDHVTWLCYPDNVAEHVSRFEKLLDIKIEGPCEKPDLGFTLYMSWEAGVEIIAPLPVKTSFNERMHEWMDKNGEGVFTVVFGVRNIEAHRERVKALGFSATDIWNEDPTSPWAGKLKLKEFLVEDTMVNAPIVFSEIDYRDDVVIVDS